MSQALKGITVVDFSHVVAGPLATHFLSLNGARIIKIEPPAGDPLRNYTVHRDQLGMAPAFKGINLGKESICLDLKTPQGLDAARALIDQADIVVENFRPGVMSRLGLDYDSLRQSNPGLIYCSISGFGQNGTMKNVAAIDQIVQSLSGLMQLSGQKGEPAMRVGFPIVDTFTGLLAAFAIQTALVQRERNLAQGQLIDVAMLDATLVMLMSVINPLLMTGEMPQRSGNRGFSRAPTADTFATAQGDITIGAVEDKQVVILLQVLGLSVLLDRPEFSDRMARITHADAMHGYLAAAFETRSALDWETDLQQAGIPAARVLSVDAALALPHLQDRDIIMEFQDGEKAVNAGFQFQTGSPQIARPAPKLGEDTKRVLASLGEATSNSREG